MTTHRASIKELLAASKMGEAAGAAMCPEVHVHRGMEGKEAERTAALVSLGRKAVIFRHGGDQGERAGAIEEVLPMLVRVRNKAGKEIVRFPEVIVRCIAAAALEELRADKCPTCRGAGKVQVAKLEGPQPMLVCPSCGGMEKKRYNEDERIQSLAREWLVFFPPDQDDKDALPRTAKEIRKHRRLRDLLFGIDYAKGKILEAERIVTEQAGLMVERWRR